MQAKKPSLAYFIAEISVTNPVEDAKIVADYPDTAEAFGGRFIVRGGQTVVFDGEPPKRLVVVAFDNLEQIRAWRESPGIKKLEMLRTQAGATIRAFAVEGCAQYSAEMAYGS